MTPDERQHRDDLKLVTRTARAHANGHCDALAICAACRRIEAILKQPPVKATSAKTKSIRRSLQKITEGMRRYYAEHGASDMLANDFLAQALAASERSNSSKPIRLT